MELFWWFFTVVLFAVGLIGTVLPVFPGTIIILAGAIIHRIMLGPEKSIGWQTIVVLGALVGLFFGIVGLFIGPIIGAILGEFIAGKRMIDASRAGWGSLLGNLGGMLGKLVIALAMITIFFMTVPPPF
jgi:uncharacterized protein YqgC (DUF456 family)